MAGPWQRAHAAALKRPEFLDLTDSRFHQNGLLPNRAVFDEAFGRWMDARAYEPDSRGARPARQALQRFYAEQGCSITDENFFLTAGTSEAYALLFSTLANAGDAVALPRPGYPLFDHIARHARLETVFYDQSFASGWQIDAESLRSCLTPQTKFVVVISPNNPTGQTANRASLDAVAEVCRSRNLMLVVDEVFDACWEGPEALLRPAALFPDVKTFTLNGISKRFGSPDLKLAWIAVTGPASWVKKTADALEMANDTFLSANSFSQFLLPDLFERLRPWQADLRALLAQNRAAVERWMTSEPRVSGFLPRGGIHGLWRFDGLPEGWDDERWAVELLNGDALALHPGYFYDVQEPGVWLVYSLLKEPGAFQRGLDRLAQRVSSLGRGPAAPE